MLSLCESEILQEYIDKPRSEMTEAEKKRVKYASIKKREQMKKQQTANFKPIKMFDLNNPAVERDYKKYLQQLKKSKMAAGKK